MAKDKTLWQLILDIISYFTSRLRKRKQNERKKLEDAIDNLHHKYNKAATKHEDKQKDTKTIDDIRDRLNDRF